MKNVPNTTNISMNDGKYIITKSKHNKMTYYGSSDNLTEAIKIRDFYKFHNWSKKCKYPKSDNRYIYPYTNNSYIIYKTINYKTYNYGIYDTLKEAQIVRDSLEQEGFPLPEKKYIKHNYPKYITVRRNNYVIVKRINGVLSTFGTYHRLEDAINERNNLIECDWDYENIECIDDTMGNESIWLGVEET